MNVEKFIEVTGENDLKQVSEIARQMVTKYTPDLRFRPDESYDAGARIDAILRRPAIARDLEPEVRLPRLSDIEDDDE